ncbi:MAG: fructose-6-phosphate aldolase [Fidelibacterota bacterium]
MKFFIDTANIREIEEAASLGILDGVTTNPTLLAKEKGDPIEILKKICEIVNGPINAEVVSLAAEGMVKEGEELARLHPNITIKIPMIKEGLKAVKILRKKGIKTNMTLIFSPAQAILAAKAGSNFISPFVGRLDDISHVGMEIVGDIAEIYRNYNFETQIIVASIRNPLHVVDAALMGAHVATIPFSVIEKMIKHPLTVIGLERFLKDWESIKKR